MPRWILALAATLVLCSGAAHAANPIQVENAKPGSTDWQLFSDASAGQVEGYASATSVANGQSISFFVNTIDIEYTLTIYRMGWYGGAGARKMLGPVTRPGSAQPMPARDPVTGLIECNWTDPYTVTIPADWTSGVYLVKLSIQNPRKDQYIPFVVRNDASTANHHMQLSVTTWQAYNNWGGKSLYSRFSDDGVAADKVSFNRPYKEGTGTGQFLWRWEYNMVRFLEREGYDVTYSTNLDTHERGSLLQAHKDFLSVGHDEYWSWEMRAAVEQARDAGVHLGFFTANACYWHVRFEPSTVNGAANRTMVGYKEDAVIKDPYAIDNDSSNNHLITGLWRTNTQKPPESALLGVQYGSDPVDGNIVVDDVTSAPWVFTATGLQSGSIIPGVLGYEVDAMTEFSPAGTIRLGHSPYVTTDGKKSGVSNMTLYTAASGAHVFATGSIQWSWGLDNWNEGRGRVGNAAQQLTRNLLERFAGPGAPTDCQFTLTPAVTSVASSSGVETIALSTTRNCAWTATSNAAWLTITSAASGTGPATITYSRPANSGPPRSGTITVGDATFTVTQQGSCTYSFNPAEGVIEREGGTGTIVITGSAPNCPWSALSRTPWLTITGGAEGVGSGTITYTVEPNSGTSRDAEIRINGIYYNVYQKSGCRYTVTPSTVAMPVSGGASSISIATDSSCFWTSSSSVSWIVVTAGASGSGVGVTSITVQPNDSGVSRSANISVAGQIVTIVQSADECTYTITPDVANYGSAAATGTFEVTPSGACAWSAEAINGSSWLSVTGGATGTGTGTVTYSLRQNTTGAARTGRIRAGGQTFSVTQSAAGHAPMSLTATALGPGSVAMEWSAVAGASGYEILRGTSIETLTLVGAVSGTSHTDNGVSPSLTYVYRVRAMSGTTQLTYSNTDIATTIAFVDPVIVPGVTTVRAAHVTQLRTAIDAVRRAAGLGSFAYAEGVGVGVPVRASHIAQMQAALAPARAVLGLSPVSLSMTSIIRAADINTLRDGVR